MARRAHALRMTDHETTPRTDDLPPARPLAPAPPDPSTEDGAAKHPSGASDTGEQSSQAHEIQRGRAVAQAALAQEVAHPFSLAYALFFAAWLHQFRREWHLTQERAEALAVVDDTGERRWEVELHRLKGELLLAHSAAHDAEAEACFRQALEPPAASRGSPGSCGPR